MIKEQMVVLAFEGKDEGMYESTDDIVVGWEGYDDKFYLQRRALSPSDQDIVRIGDKLEFTSRDGMGLLSFGESFKVRLVG